MARKYPGNQHDTAQAMSHSVGTAQKNYHSLGLKDIEKACTANNGSVGHPICCTGSA